MLLIYGSLDSKIRKNFTAVVAQLKSPHNPVLYIDTNQAFEHIIFFGNL